MKRQRHYLLCCVLFVMIHSSVAASKPDDDANCMKTREKIEKIQQKMRQKYTSKQGEKYRRQLDKLYKDEFKYCF